MDRMTVAELLLHFADDFGDWIDGDDPVEAYTLIEPRWQGIWVKFESGAQFLINVEEVHE